MSVTIENGTMIIAERFVNATEEAIKVATREMLADAKTRTPVGKTRRNNVTIDKGYPSEKHYVTYTGGHLRASSRMRFPAPGVGVVEYHASYAMYVEMGTRKMAARPYLRPAFDKTAYRLAFILREQVGA